MSVFRDLSGRSASPRALRLRGVAVMVVVLVGATLLARHDSTSDSFVVQVDARTVGDGLAAGAEVKFRGLAVGRVVSVEPRPGGGAHILASLQPAQASAMPASLTARFAPSNVFGVTGVELVETNGEGALRSGATVTDTVDDEPVGSTQLLNKVGAIIGALSSDRTGQAITQIRRTVTQAGPLIRSILDLAVVVADGRRIPLGQLLAIDSDTVNGVAAFEAPFFDLFAQVDQKTTLYDDPAAAKTTMDALDGFLHALIAAGNVVAPDKVGTLGQILDVGLDLGVPLATTLGTLGPAYQNLDVLLSRIDRTIPVVDGHPRLQLQVALERMPAVTGILAATFNRADPPAAESGGAK